MCLPLESLGGVTLAQRRGVRVECERIATCTRFGCSLRREKIKKREGKRKGKLRRESQTRLRRMMLKILSQASVVTFNYDLRKYERDGVRAHYGCLKCEPNAGLIDASCDYCITVTQILRLMIITGNVAGYPLLLPICQKPHLFFHRSSMTHSVPPFSTVVPPNNPCGLPSFFNALHRPAHSHIPHRPLPRLRWWRRVHLRHL